MKIAVYGAGNQDLYVNQLNLPEKYGGNAPYGGSRMAIEFSNAGHQVYLAEPHRDILSPNLWKIVEDSGVTVTSDDAEAGRNAEIAILFTPFGKSTFNIAKNIISHLPENGVIANTCTVSPLVLYYVLELEIKRKRSDVGICSMHPAAVPGTPQHGHYVIGGHSTNDLDLATKEQIQKCVDLARDCKKEAYVVPADVSSAVADMGSLVTAVTLSGVLDYYQVGTKIIQAPKEMVEKQILMTLQTMASLVESSGVEGLLKAMNPELLVKSASSMHLLEEQKDLDAALETLSDLDPELMENAREAEIKPTNLVAAQALAKELLALMGERASEGTIRRCMRKMFE
ncbi:H(2)-dependent methylenetetrahydromethanopterin dehydrogenase-related protein [Methanobacterium petrolearium]|uniref:H(2)-dependent methylenetetrahydromethanopterin dehydrogenase-related protein n=1 Tax=Methanobacterium petrolearium TaxID=710190 RepID=UPI001AE654A0|nr:H(2)-dependent methylenetetrahydromethanopterin dehydrogenase-related protein [Methanobacterium petrolearium]MBP1946050.1 H2-forming N(5),N(10)-methenyltetrahydromethanopterin dehydrogenase-like protein [Methanobacterium petrolearium]BDZ70814.1 methylenetetrahydromethanopterin dehydrogenase [Methanobacterium petrolearium]